MGYPWLVFISGPQAKARFQLKKSTVTAGRSSLVDIQLSEQYASRRQFTLTRSADGWIFENIAAAPCKINGKKFKTGKEVILDTGDIIQIASETEFLFVAEGDDIEAAIRKYAPIEKEQEQEVQPLQAKPAKPKKKKTKPEKDKPVDQTKAKIRKYAVIFGIYLLIIAIVAVWLGMKVKDRKKNAVYSDQPIRLTNQAINDLFSSNFEQLRNTHATRVELNNARTWYESKNDPSRLYRTVYHYRLARAYAHGDLPANLERKYRFAQTDLIKEIQNKYDIAWKFEKARQFRPAVAQYNLLLAMIPYIREYEDPMRSKILEHLAYIKRQQQAAKKKRR